MLKVYQLDLQAEICATHLALLSIEEQSIIEKYRQPLLKQRQLAVRIWLRKILAKQLMYSAKQLRFAKTDEGKPYLIDFPEIAFNLSHSDHIMLLAISDIGEVGIDIEFPKLAPRNFAAIVNKCFSISEQFYWQNLAESEKIAEFYRFWTAKEAFVKAVGRGLALGLENCIIAIDKPLRFEQLPAIYKPVQQWRLWNLTLSIPAYAALVIRDHPQITLINQIPIHIIDEFSSI
ncbi:MAG: hypothetical protein RL637_1233 [Pseudomonadota bacterium]|jgi:4'-phosphopantetheinyl transferase